MKVNLRNLDLNKSFSALNAFVSFLSTLATVGAFTLAIWAYFYSSIPEELAAKFNSEISALNEELVDIRREKRSLEETSAKEREKLNAETNSQKEKIESLQLEWEKLEEQVALLNKQKIDLGSGLIN